MLLKDNDLLVIGEIFIEFSCIGDISATDNYERDAGGNDIYVAATASRLGASVSLVSVLARDPFQSMLRNNLLEYGLNLDNVVTGEGFNGIYFLNSHGKREREYLYNRRGNAIEILNPSMVYDDLILNSRIVYASSETQSYSRDCRHTIFKAFQAAHVNNIMTAYDPNLRLHNCSLLDAKENLWSVLPLLDVLFISSPEEAKALIGYERPVDIIGFFWDRGVSIVVVKNGKYGCMVGYNGQVENFSFEGDEHNVKYPGLIGSVFNGAYLYAVTRGKDAFTAAPIALNATSYKGNKGNGLSHLPEIEDLES
ncbi:MAG: PfkB family carbohydrate kinase [Chitinivibrionales bacterium]